MIRLDLYLNSKSIKTALFIYENEEEFANSGFKEVDPRYAEKYDYYKSDDGYYLPIINISKFHVKERNIMLLKFRFPFDLLLTLALYLPADGDIKYSRFKKKSFTFKEYRGNIRRTKKTEYLNSNEVYAGELIARGIPIHDAFALAYPKLKNRTYQRDALIHKTVCKPNFVDYIMERIDMDKIKQALLNADAHKVAAQSIIDMLQANTQAGLPDLTTRKFALQAFVSIERMTEEKISEETNFSLEEEMTKSILINN